MANIKLYRVFPLTHQNSCHFQSNRNTFIWYKNVISFKMTYHLIVQIFKRNFKNKDVIEAILRTLSLYSLYFFTILQKKKIYLLSTKKHNKCIVWSNNNVFKIPNNWKKIFLIERNFEIMCETLQVVRESVRYSSISSHRGKIYFDR